MVQGKSFCISICKHKSNALCFKVTPAFFIKNQKSKIKKNKKFLQNLKNVKKHLTMRGGGYIIAI